MHLTHQRLRGICTQHTDYHNPYTFSLASFQSSLLLTIYTEHRINQANAFASALHPAFTGYEPGLAPVQLGTSYQILFILIALILLFQRAALPLIHLI